MWGCIQQLCCWRSLFSHSAASQAACEPLPCMSPITSELCSTRGRAKSAGVTRHQPVHLLPLQYAAVHACTGCAQLYRCAQTQWTSKLAVQLTLYVLFLAISMGAGGTMPWILQRYLGRPLHGSVPQQQMYREEAGYSYVNSNTYSYCMNSAAAGGK